MSLRQAPRGTPALADVARQNSTRSTGPRSPAGKERMKLNALRHGAYTAPENERAAMLALGEDPQEYEFLKGDLMLSYGPGDPLWEKQIEDLAKLYWRRRRLERLLGGLMRRALIEVEERQHQRERAVSEATFEPTMFEMLDAQIPESPDPGVLARWNLSYLELGRALVRLPLDQVVARTCVSGPRFVPEQTCSSGPPSAPPERTAADLGEQVCATPLPVRLAQALENLFRNGMGWRVARILALLRSLHLQAGDPLSADCQELVRLFDAEIAEMRQELEHAEKLQAERLAIERDTCLAPAGDTWMGLLRQEAALDRSIDRKVRIILALRKEYARWHAIVDNYPGKDEDDDYDDLDLTGDFDPSLDIPPSPAVNLKAAEQSRNVDENKGSAGGTACGKRER